jgi:hypothetical protein
MIIYNNGPKSQNDELIKSSDSDLLRLVWQCDRNRTSVFELKFVV